jgi:hypothetical protein
MGSNTNPISDNSAYCVASSTSSSFTFLCSLNTAKGVNVNGYDDIDFWIKYYEIGYAGLA